MTLKSTWISGHAIVPDWPVRGGEQRVVSADEAEAELRRVSYDLAAAEKVIESMVVAEVEPLKALLREVLDQCRETDKMQWDRHLHKRILDALGE